MFMHSLHAIPKHMQISGTKKNKNMGRDSHYLEKVCNDKTELWPHQRSLLRQPQKTTALLIRQRYVLATSNLLLTNPKNMVEMRQGRRPLIIYVCPWHPVKP